MICPNCGVNLPDTAKMCYVCKSTFNNGNSTPSGMSYYDQNINNQPSITQPQQMNFNNPNWNRKPKKSSGLQTFFITVFVVFVFIFVIVIAVAHNKDENSYEKYNKSTTESRVSERTTTSKTASTKEEEITTEASLDDYSFSETLLYSDENIEITLTSYSEDEGKPEFGMTIVNSSELDYEIYGFYTAINGIMQCGGTEEMSIAAGKTLNTKIKFRNSQFEMGDYPTIYNVAIKMVLYSSDNKITETDFKAFDIREGDYSNNNEVLYEDDNYVVYKVYVSDDLKENLLRIHNKKDYTISVGLKDFSINDIMCDCDISFSMSLGLNTYQILADIPPEYDTLVKITTSEEKLAENNITDINSIEFKLNGHNASETVYIDDGSGDSDIIRIEN